MEPNGVIISYKVYCYETDSSGSGSGDIYTEYTNATTKVVQSDVTETVVPELTPYTFYECYITANTSVGEGNTSDRVIARTDESGIGMLNL